jgi:ribosomal protein S1
MFGTGCSRRDYDLPVPADFLATIRVGDIVDGTLTDIDRHWWGVILDGCPTRPLGFLSPSDMSWQKRPEFAAGQRIVAEVISVDLDEEQVRLSTAATENPELWAFLKARRRGEILSGTVASIRPFGVFVALDDGPPHPIFDGVGFVTCPELTWRHYEDVNDVVQVGQRVSGEFLQFDIWNGEARLSLRALQPDPYATTDLAAGQEIRGTVTKVVPSGVSVRLIGDITGFLHTNEIDVAAGDEITVVVTEVDRVRHRTSLALPE